MAPGYWVTEIGNNSVGGHGLQISTLDAPSCALAVLTGVRQDPPSPVGTVFPVSRNLRQALRSDFAHWALHAGWCHGPNHDAFCAMVRALSWISCLRQRASLLPVRTGSDDAQNLSIHADSGAIFQVTKPLQFT